MIEPLFPVPPHAISPSGNLRLWYVDSPGMVSQYLGDGDYLLSDAEFILETSWRVLEDDNPPGTRFLFIHDMYRMTTYKPGVRQKFVDWVGHHRHQMGRGVICLGPQTTAIVKMGIRIAVSALEAMGTNVEIAYSDIHQVVKKYAVRPLEIFP